MSPLLNPYREPAGQWIRGNFHGHCKESSGCASVPLDEGVRKYHDVGARFMAVTDHDRVTDLRAAEAAWPDMIFLRGFEHSRAENLLFIGQDVPPLHLLSLQDAMAAAHALLTIVAHPQPRKGKTYWTREKILALGRTPDGIEVYNGHYGIPRMAAGGTQPQYTDFWDRLLTSGIRTWGFVNDDFHDPADFNNAWTMVLVEEPAAAAVVRAAKSGRFYGTTGLLLEEVAESDGRIAVATQSPCTGRFVGPGGRTLSEQAGRRFDYTADGEAYIRFEAQGDAGKLFLQPMFRG